MEKKVFWIKKINYYTKKMKKKYQYLIEVLTWNLLKKEKRKIFKRKKEYFGTKKKH